MRVICLTRCFSLFLLFCLPFVHQSQSFLAFEKKLSLSPTKHKFSLFLSLEDRLHHTERETFVISCLIKHDVIHIHYYEFHAKRAINTSVGSVRTEPATSSRDFNHKGSFSKSFFKERERERDE